MTRHETIPGDLRRSPRGRTTVSYALCPELDIASQGFPVEEARTSLVEALTFFFEVADEAEISRRLHSEVFVTQVEVPGRRGYG